MSTQPVTSSNNQGALNIGVSTTGGSVMQITGLASNLDTNSIITALLAADRQPITNLTNHENGIRAQSRQLTSLQSAFQQVAADAQALGSAALFADAQTVTSSNPTLVSATSTTGAGVGGYQVDVSQLANSSQKTFTYAPPAQADDITIDGQSVTIAAGESIAGFVNSINGNSNLDVYAAATNNNTVIFSTRATGAPPTPAAGVSADSTFINVGDSGGALTYTGRYRAGQNAQYSIDGGTIQSSSSNTVSDAIAGVTLNLNGVTTGGSPVTVDVSPPAPNTSTIEQAVQTFVTAYNAAISQTQTQLSQVPSSTDPTQGTLYDDIELSTLLNNMRTAMYMPNTSLQSGYQSLEEIGISTGVPTGGAPVSQDTLAGKLTINTTQLDDAIHSNPTAVLNLLQSWSQSFTSLVNNDAGPGGAMAQRIQDDSSQMDTLSSHIADLNRALMTKQSDLQEQFARLESTLSKSQSQGQWLAGQIASLGA